MQRLKSAPAKKIQSRKRRWISLLVALVFTSLAIARPASAEIYDQYQVKAVFLFNLTHFVHWPADTPSTPKDTFTITVFGRDKLHSHLHEVVKGELINGRTVVLRRCQTLAELEQHPGDLLFVSNSQMDRWPQIRAIASHHRMLTVSDAEGFALRSGMINLVTSEGKIRIEINMTEIKRNGFDISAKLLRLARIVHSGKDDR